MIERLKNLGIILGLVILAIVIGSQIYTSFTVSEAQREDERFDAQIDAHDPGKGMEVYVNGRKICSDPSIFADRIECP